MVYTSCIIANMIKVNFRNSKYINGSGHVINSMKNCILQGNIPLYKE